MEWTKNQYNRQYDIWVPWLEDLYLRYFTRDNKASYAARAELAKTKVTGIGPVDALQDGVNNLVAGQLGQDGVAQPGGDLLSREGVNRVERAGKDGGGEYFPREAGPLAGAGNCAVGGAADAGGKAAAAVQGGLERVGGLLALSGKRES